MFKNLIIEVNIFGGGHMNKIKINISKAFLWVFIYFGVMLIYTLVALYYIIIFSFR